MENENQVQQNIQPVQPMSQTPVSPSTNWIKILLFTILGLVVIAGAVTFSIQVGKNQTTKTNQLTSSLSKLVSPVPTDITSVTEPSKETSTPVSSIKIPEIPSDWSLNYNKTCGVSYYLPPKKELYSSNWPTRFPDVPNDQKEQKYWETQEFNNEYSPFKTDFAIYLKTIIPDMTLGIDFLCSENKDNLTTELLFKEIQAKEVEFPLVKVVKKNSIMLLGYQTYVISYLGKEYTDPQTEFFILATPKHIYRILKIDKNSDESNTNIEANNLIFNNLKLE